MNFQNLSVRAKLFLGFGSLALIVAAVSWLALVDLHGAQRRFSHYLEGINARVLLAEGVRAAVDRRAIAVRNLVLVSKPEDLAKEKAAVMQAHQDVQSRMHQLVEMAKAPDALPKARELIANMASVERSYGPIATSIVELALSGKRDEAITRMNDDCRPHLAALTEASHHYSDFAAQRSKAEVADAEKEFNTQRNLLVGASLCAILAALVAGTLISRSLSRALGAEPAELSRVALQVAQGNLAPIDAVREAPAGSVMASVGSMQANLSTIVAQVRGASESIATGASQIASGNADLSQRTEEQASALQQTAATMEELGGTVRNNADNANRANQLAEGACEVASQGGRVVSEVVASMEAINNSSKRVVDIISVIDGIAFQTNILALNAAVEAARAGEQGRGFAVVAGEVRSLAHRSAEAAKEIKSLISQSVDEVERGTSMVGQAGKTMQDIVGAIQRVNQIVTEITAASAEQRDGVSQVGQAVQNIDRVTQQNAALVEQSAAAADSLKQQAQKLVEVVGAFKLTAS